MKKILAFSGSNSSKSINEILVRAAAEKISDHTVDVINLTDYPLPIYSIDIEESEGFPSEAKAFKSLLSEYDAFVIASPEHNGSMPAVFKNTIDWVSRLSNQDDPIFGGDKPVQLLSTSPGPTGGATNLQNLSNLIPWWGGKISGTFSLGSFYDNYVEGQLVETADNDLTKVMAEFQRSIVE